MTSAARAQRLVDEFEEAACTALEESSKVRDGIAAVLHHLVLTEADPESWGAVPARTLEGLAYALDPKTLLEHALAGDATAAKQFLHEAGFTAAQGQLLPQYQPTPDAHP